ncbi:Oxidation resistance protein 1 [Rhynchospora pubera]|uniref:Oxidation resistance protein 1 n=1 Tax=Rhynchospora pubera TaxID=906938 RepID=A0AAV8GMZ4_9POAL|nr:Oxidation resistance protein 1 [Rhynchospora pubera]
MQAWKEKLAEKLSRLLADSPTSPSPPSPVARSEFHATPFTEDLTSPKRSSFSSYVLSFLPGGTGNPNSPTFEQTLPPLPPESLPNRWNSDEWENKPVLLSDSENDNKNENRYGSKFEEALEYDKKLRFSNDYEEKKMNSLHSGNYQKYLSDKSELITLDLFDFFESSLPSTIKGSHWVLLYSTWKHGISLRTLLRRSADLPGPSLLIVGDSKGAIFGGLLDCPLKPTPRRKYQGTSQTFVYTTRYGIPRLFRPTGENRYFYLCLNDALAFGGGGNFALCLDEDLLHGSSGPSETFGNECLAHDTEFELKNLELWGFTYLTSQPSN